MHLTNEQFLEEVNYSMGSIRNHMVHLAGAESRWLARLMDKPLPDYPRYDDGMTREATHAVWESCAENYRQYISMLQEDPLEEVVAYNMPHRGGLKHSVRWHILVHLVNHATDHRAQVLRILHDMGAPTFEQDYMIYLWQRGDENPYELV